MFLLLLSLLFSIVIVVVVPVVLDINVIVTVALVALFVFGLAPKSIHNAAVACFSLLAGSIVAICVH